MRLSKRSKVTQLVSKVARPQAERGVHLKSLYFEPGLWICCMNLLQCSLVLSTYDTRIDS